MKKLCIYLIMVGFFWTGWISAVEEIKIKDIENDPYKHQDETVLVKGQVVQYGEVTKKYTRYYSIRGGWGGQIEVMTEKEWPKMNESYEVRGIQIIDDSGRVRIIEQERKNLSQEALPPPPSSQWIIYMIAAAVLLLVLIIVIAVIMVTSRIKSAYMPNIPKTFGNIDIQDNPEPAEVIDGSTIKLAAPPPGTLKLLPGRFEVVSGDDTVKEIRFYKTKFRDETEIVFGRGTGPDYSFIQLKPMTVSIVHAKLLWTNGKYTLINYAVTNPTVINGKPLEKDYSITLEDGCKIEMGEVIFVFHEK